jgi:ribokinase
LAIAHDAGVTTILNPAPAIELPREVYALCDFITPNEAEASSLTGERVSGPQDAERAAETLLSWGARNVVVTLGAQGAYVKTPSADCHVPAVDAGPVVETTGAGDSFNGAFALALSEGMGVMEATRFACSAAGISVTRRGTAESMPTRSEVDALMAS